MILVQLLMGCLSTEKESDEVVQKPEESTISMETTLGKITLVLDVDNAPITSTNFIDYVNAGFYDGSDGLGATVFHRVIDDFMIQGGGFTESGTQKETLDPIENEALSSGLSNLRGTIAMARTSLPNSATSQFYINVVDNTFLDATTEEAGYTVFGTVTSGMEVADNIAVVPVNSETPVNDVVILSVQLEE